MVEKSLEFIITQFHQHQSELAYIAIGLIVGLFAQMILPGKGFGLITSGLIGIAGYWLGDHFIGVHLVFIKKEFYRQLAAGTLGAMGLSVFLGLFRIKKVKDKTKYRNNT